MPPTSDGCVRTVGCALAKLIPDAEHLDLIRGAVARVHPPPPSLRRHT